MFRHTITVRCPNCRVTKVLGLAQVDKAVQKAIGQGVHIVDSPDNILWELARVLADVQKQLEELKNNHEQ